MPSNTQNVKLGVCSVTYDGVDLGYTKGGVEVTVATETHKVNVDQFGNTPVNELIMGRTCVAKVPLAETTLENLVRIMPGASLVGSGGAKATATVTFSTGAPVDGDKVTINGVAFTFKTVPDPQNSNELAIPGTFGAAATALKNAINASIDPKVSLITASSGTSGVVNLTADDAGEAGNGIPVVATFVTPANCTVVAFAGGTDPEKKKVLVPTGTGVSLLSIARRLVLHPIANPPEQRNEDFVMPLAATAGALTFAYKHDDERVYNAEFNAYPDSANDGLLFVVGDESAT